MYKNECTACDGTGIIESNYFRLKATAREIAELIVRGEEDPRLRYFPDGSVRVFVYKTIPVSKGEYTQTRDNRRSRFGKWLVKFLDEHRWAYIGHATYRPAALTRV